MIEKVLGVEIIVTSGARCPEHNAEVGGKPHSKHLIHPDGDPATFISSAVDFWPLDMSTPEEGRWNRKRFEFFEFVRKYFDYCYIGTVDRDGRKKWFVHGQLNKEVQTHEQDKVGTLGAQATV